MSPNAGDVFLVAIADTGLREKGRLEYLEAGLSNQQIADGTEASLTTAKWHRQHLCEKLRLFSHNAAVVELGYLHLMNCWALSCSYIF